MQGYLCSSASSCPGKGPPQLNICTSTRLITHNTPAQPLPSLSPPQSSLERSREKGEGEKNVPSCRFSSYSFTIQCCIFSQFFRLRDDETQCLAVLPFTKKRFVYVPKCFHVAALSLVIFLKHFKLKETLIRSCLRSLCPPFTLFSRLTFVIYPFIYFPAKYRFEDREQLGPFWG